MNNCFCTLFDSRYLDKGIVLYHSLKRTCPDFILYILSLDDRCLDILRQMKLQNVVVVSYRDFETPELASIKKQRTNAEFCWTCTPGFIAYVFEYYHEEVCTYIDADMAFYSDPSPLIQEMRDAKCSVQIVEHRFQGKKREHLIDVHGRFCVEFNTFLSDESGMKCLEWWLNSCLKSCQYTKKSGGVVGDQKYLESFEKKFDHVHILQDIGGGIAPWNFSNYQYKKTTDGLFVTEKKLEDWHQIVFCHFQNIRYLPFNFVNTGSGTSSKFVKKELYVPYLIEIEKIRNFLHSTYNLSFERKKSCYRNPFMKLIQEYIIPFKIRRISDLVYLGGKKYDSK